MAPGDGGQRLAIEKVGEKVVQWLENDAPLPPEWDGASLMTLVYTTCTCMTVRVYLCMHGRLLHHPCMHTVCVCVCVHVHVCV